MLFLLASICFPWALGIIYSASSTAWQVPPTELHLQPCILLLLSPAAWTYIVTASSLPPLPLLSSGELELASELRL